VGLGVFENNNLPTVRVAESVDDLFGEEVFLIDEVGEHGVAIDLVGLENKKVPDGKHS